MNLEAARVDMSQMRAKLDAAAVEVLQSGRDWCEGPMTFGPEYPDEPHNLMDQPAHQIEVKCGPCDADYIPPEGWRVIRHADWVAAGKPGLWEASHNTQLIGNVLNSKACDSPV